MPLWRSLSFRQTVSPLLLPRTYRKGFFTEKTRFCSSARLCSTRIRPHYSAGCACASTAARLFARSPQNTCKGVRARRSPLSTTAHASASVPLYLPVLLHPTSTIQRIFSLRRRCREHPGKHRAR
ncbi:hypothetical protein ABB37_09558 [Leptomonas pyrrhocoris]|uniref:Uncharacterized protein n=1 Tax=Leptomonas pyrrhocoris TaxID=157538 RepID=A0A0M9FQK8_LEPPY|nr:hypothetical protein ABB37_09558 [Leptomonas pyrrhocoris]KPA73987.1 hypothetical protein ABB37_09558 [Leptomonas pyrrhocoris]|eukprot:XP_015652426.1 hypothetical protein ABB37_09558 [Leptomonas pyrrhocoris]